MNYLLIIVSLIFGWIGGTIANYLADVLPATRRLSQPACDACKSPYPWLDYLFLRRCHACNSRRNIRAGIVILVLVIGSGLTWLFPRPILAYPLAMVIYTYFGVVAVIDLEHRVVLHPVSLAGAVLGISAGIYLRGGVSITAGILTTLAGGAAGFLVMLAMYFLGTLYVKWMAKRKGIPSDEVALGYGDVNLAGILGLLLGWPAIMVCLFFAVLGGGLISLLIIAFSMATKKYKPHTAIPYAPFLLLSALYLLVS